MSPEKIAVPASDTYKQDQQGHMDPPTPTFLMLAMMVPMAETTAGDLPKESLSSQAWCILFDPQPKHFCVISITVPTEPISFLSLLVLRMKNVMISLS